MSKHVATTKEHILELLKKNKRMTVSEIARHLEITEMAVRRHLNTLEKDKIVHTKLVRQSMGRPVNVYELTNDGEEIFPRNYVNLTIDLLQELEQMNGKKTIERLFRRRKERLKEKYVDVLNEPVFAKKIEKLAQIQNENGYMAEWEKGTDGTYIFKEYNCPISKIAKLYPIACQCERELFKDLLKTDNIECKACIALNETSHCCYEIREA